MQREKRSKGDKDSFIVIQRRAKHAVGSRAVGTIYLVTPGFHVGPECPPLNDENGSV